jgi:stage II sporulation protein AA (anti-sigma F factor antagonist)
MAEDEAPNPAGAAQAEQLSVRSTEVGGVRLLTLAGEIDHATGGPLRTALLERAEVSPHVVVDLGRVTFMDSSGINVFIAAHHALSAAGGWLRLAAAGNEVLRTLRIVGVDMVITCPATVEEALGTAGQGTS